jgi:chromosome segregation ATPase
MSRTSGSHIHNAIWASARAQENEQEAVSRSLRDVESRLNNAVAGRQEIYQRLAQMFLPRLDADAVRDTLSEVQKTVQDCFLRKQERRRQLETGLKENRDRRQEVQNRLDLITAQLETKARERGEIEKKVAETLAANSAYEQARLTAEQNRKSLESSRSRAAAFAEQAKKKIEEFEREPLFTYLAKRKFGTQEYSGGMWTRSLDGRVANLVFYRENKRNYDRLNALPGFIGEEIRRQQAALDESVAGLRRQEEEAGAGFGLPKIMAEGKQLAEQGARFSELVAASDKDYAAITAELNSLDTMKDEFHGQALNHLKSFLQGETVASLRERARNTPGAEDDQWVSRLEQVERDIAAGRREAGDLKAQQRECARKLSELSQLHNWFAQHDYNGCRSFFRDSFDVNALLQGYLLGQIGEAALRQSLSAAQYFQVVTPVLSSQTFGADTSSGWGGASSWGGSSDSGGGGGGSFSSDSGGSSSGGFTTTDSF